MSTLQHTAPTPEITPSDRLTLTLFLALIAHALVIFGVVFVAGKPSPVPRSTLNVVLVQSRSLKAPRHADFIAQANQDGGGNSTEVHAPRSPLPAPFLAHEAKVVSAAPPVPVRAPRAAHGETHHRPVARAKAKPMRLIAQTERATRRRVMVPRHTGARGKAPVRAARPVPPKVVAPQPSVEASTLMARSLAMASLSATIDQRLQSLARRPREKWITARTRASVYAAYMEAWRQKVERIGNLNYPEAAIQRQLSGSLLLDVALNPDGSVHSIHVVRSSGSRLLDDAAKRIVHLAAPFAPFPRAIAAKVGILHIERTWKFVDGKGFSGG